MCTVASRHPPDAEAEAAASANASELPELMASATAYSQWSHHESHVSKQQNEHNHLRECKHCKQHVCRYHMLPFIAAPPVQTLRSCQMRQPGASCLSWLWQWLWPAEIQGMNLCWN